MPGCVSGLRALVAELSGLAPHRIDLATVSELLGAIEVGDADLRPFLHFDRSRYTRNLVHRCEHFDVVVLCWSPGQTTPVHDHSGQLGWVRVLHGRLEEVSYAVERRQPEGRTAAADSACQFLKRVRLREDGRTVVPAGEAVVTVDAERAIHRLGNPSTPGSPDAEDAVSLHVYSKPHDVCSVFDVATGDVRQRELRFDTTLTAVSTP